MPLVSIVVPNFNGEKKLPILFKSIMAQDVPLEMMEVVVGDDGSTDRSIEVMDSYSEKGLPLRHASHDGNKGRAATCNLAISLARGDIIIICDNDFELPSGCVAAHLRSHEGKSGIIVIGALENIHTRRTIYTDFLDTFQKAHNAWCEGHAGHLPFIYFRANASFKKRELPQGLLFNESFRSWGFEDIELGYRLEQSGLRLIYDPEAGVRHYLSEDSFELRCRRNYETGQNKALFVKLFPGAKYDLPGREFNCRKFSARLNYFIRYCVCHAIIHAPFTTDRKILEALLRLTKWVEKRGRRFLLFALYHIVAGMHLEVSYFKSLSGKAS